LRVTDAEWTGNSLSTVDGGGQKHSTRTNRTTACLSPPKPPDAHGIRDARMASGKLPLLFIHPLALGSWVTVEVAGLRRRLRRHNVDLVFTLQLVLESRQAFSFCSFWWCRFLLLLLLFLFSSSHQTSHSFRRRGNILRCKAAGELGSPASILSFSFSFSSVQVIFFLSGTGWPFFIVIFPAF